MINKALADALRKAIMGVKQQDKDKPDPAAQGPGRAPPGQGPAGPPQGQPPPGRQAIPQPRVAGFQRPLVDVITPAVQAGILGDAIARTEDAIGDELKSRVSQAREMRRMEHEKDIEQIRAQSMLERVRQARMAEDMANGFVAPGLIDLTGTARRID